MIGDVGAALLSLSVIVAGVVVMRRGRSVMGRRSGWVVVALGIASNPLLMVVSGRFVAVHALVSVVVLALPLVLFWQELTQSDEPLERFGRLVAWTVRWVWLVAVVDDVLVLGQFEGFWQSAIHTVPLLGTVTVVVQGGAAAFAMTVLMGDGRPRITHIRQVVVAWTSAMVIMGVGIAMGLAPGTWYGYLVRRDGLLGAMTDQQVAAAILVIGGGAVWFVLGAQKMRLWLDAEERDGLKGRLTGGVRIGRSVRRRS